MDRIVRILLIYSMLILLVQSACSTGCLWGSCRRNFCTACSAGYYLYSNNCSACTGSCLTCSYSSSTYQCNSCSSGYYVQKQDQTCQPCASQCLTCSSISVCSACSIGYYLSNSSCTTCPAGCLACSSNSSCSNCSANYTLSGSKCLLVSTSQEGSSSLNKAMIIGIAAGASGLFVLLATILICRKIRSNRGRQRAPAPADSSKEMLGDIEVVWTAADTGSCNKQNQCCICQAGAGNLTTECGHQFHPHCLYEWGKRKETCPICRKEMKSVKVYCQKCARLHFEIKIKEIPELNKRQMISCKNCEEFQM